MRKAFVRAIATHLPKGRLTNEQLAAEFEGWDAAKILEKTGISERAIAAPDECSSDLAVAAAKELFDSGAGVPSDVGFLLFCTQSPDYFLPTTACTIQQRLGLPTSVGALDFNQGCSGYVYGLALAKGILESGAADTLLLLTGETYSKFIHPGDRSVRTIFGDAGTATLLGVKEADHDLVGPFVFGTDGRGCGNLIVPVGGMRRPLDAEADVEHVDASGNVRADRNLFMNGPEIFNFTLQAVPASVSGLLRSAGRSAEEVDLYVFHQANRFMLERLRAKMKIPPERFWVDLETTGNTVSATIPIALQGALRKGALGPGNRSMLVGFGVGYSWAACMLEIQ